MSRIVADVCCHAGSRHFERYLSAQVTESGTVGCARPVPARGVRVM